MHDHRDLWWESPTRELGTVVSLDLPEPFTADHGGILESIQVSYESWGTLNAARDNAILVVHPMTSDPHATGEFEGREMGWWEPLIGPGRALDTDTHFVVCPNLIGGCYGTTGPRFPGPDGEPWYDRFPLLTPRDMMRVQKRFLETLGIGRLALVIGPSMGGMVAWEWAVEHPEACDRVAVVAAPLRTSPHQIGLNWLQRRGIELDITENEVVARWGQMVARGVGMLSYRSPTGLEEKFGRDWFKEPGSTLGERGMFNIESWLRHHGKRITKRFDPYTYLLFSRAMDLHDVAEGRGDLVSALDRVTCPVLIVGISSDNLYPAEEVRQSADILDHLGRPGRYEEIRSLHGHDAFLLDTDQLDGMLRRFLAPEAPVAIPAGRELRHVRIGILGAGRVAASFVRVLGERRERLASVHGIRAEIRAVAEIDPNKALPEEFEGLEVTHDPGSMVKRDDLDVILDLTRGLGALPQVEVALTRRRPVVTPNKVLVSAYGDSLERLALERGVRLAYHDSIAAGWPLIHALERPLGRGRVNGIEAMLSSTCNLVLQAIEAGGSFQEGLSRAVEMDLAEPDPGLDVSGWDSAQKLVILMSRLLGRRYSTHQLEVLGIGGVDPELVRVVPGIGLRVKLIALVVHGETGHTATVRPMAVPAESHLGVVRGENHVVVLRTRDGGEMVHSGSGAGATPVATAVLNDLVGLFDPTHSWTGRYPAATEAPRPVAFERWLVLEGGEPAVSEIARPGSVPVLGVEPGPERG